MLFFINFLKSSNIINIEDLQSISNQSTTPAKCILCQTLLISKIIVIYNVENVGIEPSDSVPATITHGGQKQLFVCPNDDCNCSLGPNKGIYLVDNSLATGQGNQATNLTEKQLSDSSESIVCCQSCDFESVLYDD